MLRRLFPFATDLWQHRDWQFTLRNGELRWTSNSRATQGCGAGRSTGHHLARLVAAGIAACYLGHAAFRK